MNVVNLLLACRAARRTNCDQMLANPLLAHGVPVAIPWSLFADLTSRVEC